MTNAPGILLLPPPASPVAAATKADRATVLSPIAPVQPLPADKGWADKGWADKGWTDGGWSDRDVASDHLGFRGFRQSGSSARNATAAPEQGSGGERWLAALPIDAAAHAAGSPLVQLPFLAQQIAQEALSSGLHREPWEAGLTAYRRAGGDPPLPTSGSALVQLSA